MKTDKVFIVNTDQGPRVVTPGVIEKGILAMYPKDAPKVKAKDVESYAQDLASELIGQAISNDLFEQHIYEATEALAGFAVLTPFKYGKMLNQMLNQRNSL